MTRTRQTVYIVAIVEDIVEDMINDYKAKVEVLIEVYSEVITRRSAMFIKSQIAS